MQVVEAVAVHTAASVPNFGYVGKIPVRSLWFLLLYASDLLQHQPRVRQSIEDSPDDVTELVAKVLTHHVERRIKQNLSLGYLSRRDDLRRVRGRIDLLQTERRHLLQRGRITCRYEEFAVDTPRNRYVVAALHELARLVSSQSSRRCHSLATIFEKMGVARERPAWSEVVADQIGRHNINDREMLDAARLAFELTLPVEEAGNRLHISPDRDDVWVRKLFEKAIAGFYKVTLSKHGWKIRPRVQMFWPITTKSSDEIDRIFPCMEADIILDHRNQGKRIIIDTKFTSLLQKGWWRDETLRSNYLYQIYTYVRSQEKEDDPLSKDASGLLLHPSVGADINQFVEIQGHKIHFATIDLTAGTSVIRDQLLNVIEDQGS